MSVPELGEQVGVEVVELALDVADHDAEDEDAHEQVEEDAQLHGEGQGAAQGEADHEDAVLHDQVAHDLGDGLAPAHDEEEADEDRGEGGRNEQSGKVGAGERQAGGDPEGETDEGRSQEQGEVEASFIMGQMSKLFPILMQRQTKAMLGEKQGNEFVNEFQGMLKDYFMVDLDTIDSKEERVFAWIIRITFM